MSLTFSQAASQYTAPATSIVKAFGSNVTAGNLLIVTAQGGSTSQTLNTPTDTLGNTYVLITSAHSTNPSNGVWEYMWWAIANGSGANTVTITPTTGSVQMFMNIGEWTVSGVAPTLDGFGSTATTNNIAVTTLTATSSAAAGATDLVVTSFCAGGGGTSSTITTGYTQRTADVIGGGPYQVLADKTAGSSGAQSATWTFSSSTVQGALIANFQQAVVVVPTVTTQAASSTTATGTTGNGNITNLGGAANCTAEGFVYGTASQSLPGNVAPGSTAYTSFVTQSGTFSTGAFTEAITGLANNTTYYIRAWAQNATGYAYGAEVSFTTNAVAAVGGVLQISGIFW